MVVSNTTRWPLPLELSQRNLSIWGKMLFVTLIAFVVACTLATDWVIPNGDTPYYKSESHAIWGGAIPYRDVLIEYPPGVLPFILLAQPIGWLVGGYTAGFGIMTIIIITILFRYIYELYGMDGVVISGLILLPIAQYFFFDLDIFDAVALFGALMMFTQKRFRLAAVLLAVSVLIKGYPVVCLPIFLLSLPRAKAIKFLKDFLLTVGAVLLPFILISPSGMWQSLSYHLGRPIEILSGAATLGLWSGLFRKSTTIFSSHRSVSIAFPGSGVLSLAATLILIVSLVWLTYWFYKLKTKPDIALGCLIALLVFIIFFKVGSPQYIAPIWSVAALVSIKLNSKERYQLLSRLLALGVATFLISIELLNLIKLDGFAIFLDTVRYVLLFELLIWSIRKARATASTKKI